MEEKRFDEWNEVKKNTHGLRRMRAMMEGEGWWCARGEHVVVECVGKSEVFSRPVLVLKKLSRFGFMGIPLTSQMHEGDWYVPFVFQGKTSVAVLSQARTFSVLRLCRRMGTLPESDLNAVAIGFDRLYGIH